MAEPSYRQKFRIETVHNEIVNIHGRREEFEDDIAEQQEMVIATFSLSSEDWCHCRTFAWMTAFLHFDKILQIPFIVIHSLLNVAYRELIDAFINAESNRWPIVASIQNLFMKEAESIQKGGTEYTYSKEWLGIYWPADEYVYIWLTVEKLIDAFYYEAREILIEVCTRHGGTDEIKEIVVDAIYLNASLLHQPYQLNDIEIELKYDILGLYNAVRCGGEAIIHKQLNVVNIERSRRFYDDFDAWCREVVWWGNKKGAYLYGNHFSSCELAGHY